MWESKYLRDSLTLRQNKASNVNLIDYGQYKISFYNISEKNWEN